MVYYGSPSSTRQQGLVLLMSEDDMFIPLSFPVSDGLLCRLLWQLALVLLCPTPCCRLMSREQQRRCMGKGYHWAPHCYARTFGMSLSALWHLDWLLYGYGIVLNVGCHSWNPLTILLSLCVPLMEDYKYDRLSSVLILETRVYICRITSSIGGTSRVTPSVSFVHI